MTHWGVTAWDWVKRQPPESEARRSQRLANLAEERALETTQQRYYFYFVCAIVYRIQEITPQIGRCTKCNMMQRLERCTKQLYAKLLVSVGQHDHQLHAYLPMIKLITKDDTITDDTHTDEVTTQLLLSDPFQTTSHVINSVSHKTSQD